MIPQGDSADRRDMLAEQLNSAEEIPEPVAAPVEAEPVKAEPAKTETKTEPGTDGRVRAADGKFAPKAAAAGPQATAETPAPVVEEPVWKRPPASWKKEHHEAWAKADPRFQEYAYQREEQMKAGVQPLMEKAKYADAMQQVIEPYMPTIRGLGIDAPRAVKALMEADRVLRTSSPDAKKQYFARLAQQYGVNLGEIAPLTQGVVDPMVYALQNEITNVRGQFQGFLQQQEEAKNAALQGEISSFALKNEHFETVRPTMARLLQSGEATDLQDAYDKAIWINPDLRTSVQQASQAQVTLASRAAADKAAKAARSAAVSVRSSTPGTTTATKAQDRRAMLAEQFDGVDARL